MIPTCARGVPTLQNPAVTAYDVAKVFTMGKKTVLRAISKPAFRESDFAGRPPEEQAILSGSLNQLSQQIAASRQLLQEMSPVDKRLESLAEPQKKETTGSS
jgi:hypothetical protein